MKCPNCSAETSDMLVNCEWCGAPISAAPSTGGLQPGGGAPVQPGEYGAQQPYAAGSPSDAHYHDPYAPGPEPSGPNPEPRRPWYFSPVLFLVVFLVVLGVVAGVLIAGKSAGGTYASLVVDGKPTLLDVYTDS